MSAARSLPSTVVCCEARRGLTAATESGRRLLEGEDPLAPFLWSHDGVLSVQEFLGAALALSRSLPQAGSVVNLCDRRDLFLIAWCAAVLRGQTNLLPSSRAPKVVAEVRSAWEGSYLLDDERVQQALLSPPLPVPPAQLPPVPAAQIVQIAFTSGSTGVPQGHAKRWGGLWGSSRCNAARIRACLADRYGNARPGIVATVPPQHMWGSETTVLLPLLEGMAVHAARPLFPADVVQALAQVPEPRVLVSTPVHLRTLLAAGITLPRIGVVVSATAPLDAATAAAVEQDWDAPMLEMFGSTETCVFASRLTSREQSWWLYPGVGIEPHEDHALVSAPWFERAMPLQDVVELGPDGRMSILGRNADMIEIAGKRASLADLTRRLQGIPGVQDAVVFQPTAEEAAQSGVVAVRRVAALVVAPDLTEGEITRQLATSVDPAFLPRPLVRVASLPRNAVGKLARKALLQAAFGAAAGDKPL